MSSRATIPVKTSLACLTSSFGHHYLKGLLFNTKQTFLLSIHSERATAPQNYVLYSRTGTPVPTCVTILHTSPCSARSHSHGAFCRLGRTSSQQWPANRRSRRPAHMTAPAALPCSGPEVTRAQRTNNCTTITAISRPLQPRSAPEPYPHSGPVAARDPS